MGANEVVVTDAAGTWAQAAGTSLRLELILDTVAMSHDLNPHLGCLDRDGAMVLVGLPPTPHAAVLANRLTGKRRSLAGSGIGGMAETREMPDFCARHRLTCDIEMIRIQQINEAYARMLKRDVKYRFVIDMASLRG